MNRRTFVGASAGFGFAIRAFAADSRGPHLSFPTAPRERLAVSSWPFRKLLSPRGGTLRLESFPAMVVSRFGVKGIEPLSNHFLQSDPAYLDRIRNAIEKAGAHIVNIPVSPKGSLYDPDVQKRNGAIETTKHWIDVAGAVGSPSIRVSIQGVPNIAPDPARTIESLKVLSDYGRQKNIIVNLENDDPHSEDAFFLLDVIKNTNNAFLRALPDFCNSMLEKHGDEAFNYSAVKAMFGRAYNICHVKDSELDGERLYRVSVERCFAIARASGYRGYFSMEWEGAGEPFGGTQKLIELTLKNI